MISRMTGTTVRMDCQNEGEMFKVAGFVMVLLLTFLCGL
jgi:hypothetical protein